MSEKSEYEISNICARGRALLSAPKAKSINGKKLRLLKHFNSILNAIRSMKYNRWRSIYRSKSCFDNQFANTFEKKIENITTSKGREQNMGKNHTAERWLQLTIFPFDISPNICVVLDLYSIMKWEIFVSTHYLFFSVIRDFL